MSGAVLITGGAGFIGSHLADALLQRGRKVRVLDNLDSQVHGEARRRPDYLDADVELVGGDIRDSDAGRLKPAPAPLTPVATPEWKPPSLASVYALSKFDQERLCILIGRAYGIPTVALRFFNVYGTRQALSNPYTGVLAIFASRLLNNRSPLVNEDGRQRRDFVSVLDVAQACVLAMEKAPEVSGEAFNVGSGRNYTVLEVARKLAEVLGKKIAPEITETYRVGDIRHCFADISHARELLGYEPKVDCEHGILRLAQWLEGQIAVDRVAQAAAELSARGLTV